jgi:hypothetical protein
MAAAGAMVVGVAGCGTAAPPLPALVRGGILQELVYTGSLYRTYSAHWVLVTDASLQEKDPIIADAVTNGGSANVTSVYVAQIEGMFWLRQPTPTLSVVASGRYLAVALPLPVGTASYSTWANIFKHPLDLGQLGTVHDGRLAGLHREPLTRVPDVVGLSMQVSLPLFEHRHLKVKVKAVEAGLIPTTVVREVPGMGSRLSPGRAVTLYICRVGT